MSRCPKCPHLFHDGQVCRYPQQVIVVAGQTVERCGCTFRARVHGGAGYRSRPFAFKRQASGRAV